MFADGIQPVLKSLSCFTETKEKQSSLGVRGTVDLESI